MTILVTGAAGFIGFHLCQRLLAEGRALVGVDALTPYYDVRLKRARLRLLQSHKGFTFVAADIADDNFFGAAVDRAAPRDSVHYIMHLAAQPGVRHSIDHPQEYARANLVGHLNMLEYARSCPNLAHMVYASSSSVYGGHTTLPHKESDPIMAPVSLYAATKAADELMSHSYSHLHGLPLTGLRLFTVYGPWGRPDMAPWLFTDAIIEGRPITLFHHGQAKRDFTFIDDAISGITGLMELPCPSAPRHRLFNLGNDRPEELTYFVDVLEQAIGRTAIRNLVPAQPGDVAATHADISRLNRLTGYAPTTRITEGLPEFVDWFRWYHEGEG